MAEIVFQGSSAIALDAKGRITVPVRQRELLMQACEGRLTLTTADGDFLWMMPRPAWEHTRAQLLGMGLAAERWRRRLIGNAVDVDVDAAGRVMVSPELRKFAGLVKEVVLVGTGHKLELWDAARLDAHHRELMSQPMPAALQELVLG